MNKQSETELLNVTKVAPGVYIDASQEGVTLIVDRCTTCHEFYAMSLLNRHECGDCSRKAIEEIRARSIKKTLWEELKEWVKK